MFILVSMGNYISTDDVRFVLAYNGSTVSKEMYKAAGAESRLVNLTRGKAIRSLIVLSDNTVVATPVKASTVIRKLNGNDPAEKEPEPQKIYYYVSDDEDSD
ncbi:DUF370 domain-containing protein [bacterium]|nr:DUF370 domain-containing protein [bacterium]